ncbi:LysR family transcriptional regulator [Mesorhizobium sp. B3-1-3]|uniref:LysR family transcriptional regulator n=1 Tax=unclassified Mesorhizobium TaxID=325217 RepID=UPI0011293096|nr:MULTISPECIES: LysR family transcriptional regulator [unclassified Mesorhizobium]TPI64850.1 LysR family transcriptional regulator [Mesorhizobium sp. B3-1-3]TPI69640.1 LysR family transcriptional regulator [Mesorhizobium sp. B3-1-8]
MLDALTLDQVRTFVAVADTGSFRKAGLKLGRAQSAISHAIARLETEIGVSLFDRNSHRPTLTIEGRALLEDARSLLLRTDLLRAKAQGMGEGVEVELSIVVDTLFSTDIVAEALAKMQLAFPMVSVRVRVGTLGEPLEALKERRADLAVTVGEDLRDPRIEFESIARLTMVAVAASAHPLVARKNSARVQSAELTDHIQIVIEDPSEAAPGRDFGVLSPRTWRVGDQQTKLALIRAGAGWGRLPYWIVRQDLAEGRLGRVLTAALGGKGEILSWVYLAHRLDRPLRPAAKLLRTALEQVIASKATAFEL